MCTRSVRFPAISRAVLQPFSAQCDHTAACTIERLGLQGISWPHAPHPAREHAGEVWDGGVVRQYYVAAERQLWDHIPVGAGACSGAPQPLTGDAALRAFNNASVGTIGSQRWRGTFYEYTDASFATRKVCDGLGSVLTLLRQQADLDSPFKNPHACIAIKGSEGRCACTAAEPSQTHERI